MVFGQLEIKTVMHRLLRKYRLELARPRVQGDSCDYGGMPVPMRHEGHARSLLRRRWRELSPRVRAAPYSVRPAAGSRRR